MSTEFHNPTGGVPKASGAGKPPVVSSAQCRAARAWLCWTQAELAVESGVARKTVADFENAARVLHYRTQLALTAALTQAGVMFIWDGSDGVRLPNRATASSSTQAATSASAHP